jgi:hypothetical protein
MGPKYFMCSPNKDFYRVPYAVISDFSSQQAAFMAGQQNIENMKLPGSDKRSIISTGNKSKPALKPTLN